MLEIILGIYRPYIYAQTHECTHHHLFMCFRGIESSSCCCVTWRRTRLLSRVTVVGYTNLSLDEVCDYFFEVIFTFFQEYSVLRILKPVENLCKRFLIPFRGANSRLDPCRTLQWAWVVKTPQIWTSGKIAVRLSW